MNSIQQTMAKPSVDHHSVVRYLGIYIDTDVRMRCRAAKTVSACFAVLGQLRCIRRSVTRLQSLVASLVLSRLDYGNASLDTGILPTMCSL